MENVTHITNRMFSSIIKRNKCLARFVKRSIRSTQCMHMYATWKLMVALLFCRRTRRVVHWLPAIAVRQEYVFIQQFMSHPAMTQMPTGVPWIKQCLAVASLQVAAFLSSVAVALLSSELNSSSIAKLFYWPRRAISPSISEAPAQRSFWKNKTTKGQDNRH